jgi:hypothetical protein
MWKILKVKSVFLFLLVFTILFIFSVAFALEVNWPKSPLGTDLVASCSTIQATSSCNFATLTKYFYEWGIALGGLATFVALVIAGFQYLTSMGEPARLAEARGKIRSAIFGLILLLGSWIILNTINPQLLGFSPLPISPTSTLQNLSQCSSPEECVINCLKAQPINERWDCYKYDFKCDMGICKATTKPCDYVKVYRDINFKGEIAQIKPGEVNNTSEIMNAKSLQAFFLNGKECGPSGCGCFVNLYAGGKIFASECGDVLATNVAYLPDIYSVIDRPLRCIKVTTTTWQFP